MSRQATGEGLPKVNATETFPCEVCQNLKGNRGFTAREMMFGMRDEFHYQECGACGCLQLLDIPSDMARYYPEGYYSFQEHGRAKTWLRRRWSRHAYGNHNLEGWLFSLVFFPNKAMESVRRVNPSRDASILDIGCGAGRLLLDLHYLGFRNLQGADPYVAKDLRYENGVVVHKLPLEQLSGTFDLIMLHHSFEHMDSPAEVFGHLARLLKPSGTIILRIPAAASYAWRKYGRHWFNLDAPRHLFLHTERSIGMLAQGHGLKVKKAIHEGDEGVLWASEAYAHNIAVSEPQFPFQGVAKRLLGYPKLRKYRKLAARINEAREADQISFELVKADAVQ